MIFKSHQVNSDPEPWVCEFGCNHVTDPGDGRYQPRPEFEPTRDPQPWRCGAIIGATREEVAAEFWPGAPVEYAPDRERFDTPVNPILVEVRLNSLTPEYDGWTPAVAASYYLEEVLPDEEHNRLRGWTPEHVDHARRVLTRLIRMKEITTDG